VPKSSKFVAEKGGRHFRNLARVTNGDVAGDDLKPVKVT
jgi:hypothetical protein